MRREIRIGATVLIPVGALVWLVLVVRHLGCRHLDLTAVSSIGVAIATLLLALVTVGMVSEARRETKASLKLVEQNADQVRAQQDQVEVTVNAMRAGIRPWLTAGDSDVRITADAVGRALITVVLANVGNGLALIKPGSIQFVMHEGTPVTHPALTAWASIVALPQTDRTYVYFSIKLTDLEPPWNLGRFLSGGQFDVLVSYADVNGEQETRLKIAVEVEADPTSISTVGSGHWVIRSITYERDDAAPWLSTFDAPWT
jgi:energy-converting hydrogenase Eha subunit C